MSVQNQVGCNFLEGIGLVVGDGLLCAVNHTGLKRRVELCEGNDGGVCAQSLYGGNHNGVIGNTQLHSGQIFN